MGKGYRSYLLTCPICGKKMWLTHADQHRKARHPGVCRAEFQNRLLQAVSTGRIKVRTFDDAVPNLVSGTQRIQATAKLSKGVRSIVSGGRVP